MVAMTDDEALRLIPGVNEFVQAVRERDVEFVEACIQHSSARALAVWCAEFAGVAQDRIKELTDGNNRLRAEVMDLRQRRDDLRKMLDAKVAASTANSQSRARRSA